MTLRYLVHHFGESKTLGTITVSQAESWIEALAGGRLSGARNETERHRSVGKQRVRSHIRNARAIVYWAMKVGRLGKSRLNPFTDFESKPLASNDNAYGPAGGVRQDSGDDHEAGRAGVPGEAPRSQQPARAPGAG